MYIEDILNSIVKRLDRIDRRLDQAEQKGVMTVADIAAYTGVAKALLYTTKRYLLPDFGKKKGDGQRMEWTKREVMDWLDRGSEILKKEWECVNLNEKGA